MVLFPLSGLLRGIIFIPTLFINPIDRKTYIFTFILFESFSSEMLPCGRDQIHFFRRPLPLLLAIHERLSFG